MPSLSKNAGEHRSIHAMRVATIRQVAPAQRAQKSAKAREVKLQFSACISPNYAVPLAIFIMRIPHLEPNRYHRDN